jgi:hypothetical protein
MNTAPVQLATVLLLVLIVENVSETLILMPIHLLWFYMQLTLLILAGATHSAEES